MASRWAVQRLFREDLPAKSYGKLRRSFVQSEQMRPSRGRSPIPPARTGCSGRGSCEKLGPHDGLGPGYGADEVWDAISRRYKNPLALVRHALLRLVRDSR